MRMAKPPKFEREFAFLDGDFPLDVATWENHPDYPLHTHDFTVIVIVVHGSGINVVGKEEFPVKAGEVFVLHGTRPHGYRATKDLSVINVVYDRTLLNQVCFDVAGLPGYQALFVVEPVLRLAEGEIHRHMHLDVEELAKVRGLANELERELHAGMPRRAAVKFSDRHRMKTENSAMSSGEPGYRFIAMAHFMTLVGMLSRLYGTQPARESEKIMKIGRAISHMERHFEEEIDLSVLAQMVGMSDRNFYRFFGKVTNESPYSYLQRLRITKAAKLLQTTDKNVTEVAFQCGFNDSSYFARQFRRVLGVSPREFQAGAKPATPHDRAARNSVRAGTASKPGRRPARLKNGH